MIFQIKGALYFHVSDIYAIRSNKSIAKLDFHLSVTGESQDPQNTYKQIASLKGRAKKAMKTHMKKAKKRVLNLYDLWI